MSEPTKFELFLEWLRQLFCFHKWEDGDEELRIACGYYWYQVCVKCGKERFK